MPGLGLDVPRHLNTYSFFLLFYISPELYLIHFSSSLIVHFFHFKCSRYCICIISFVVLVWKYSCHACTLSHSILALTIPQGSLGINKSFLHKCPGIRKILCGECPPGGRTLRNIIFPVTI